MRLELTRVGFLVKVANHYTTKGAQGIYIYIYIWVYLYIIIIKSCSLTIRFFYQSFFAGSPDRNNGLVWFYDISNIVGHLMPNLVYTYILSTYDL